MTATGDEDMNRVLKTAAAGVLFSGLILAQGRPGPRDATPPDPTTMIANQVTRLTTLLDLTTAQATSITGILTAAESSVSTLHTTLSADQTNLNTAITSNNTATIDALAAAIGAIQGQILDAHAKAEAQIYVLLTSTQQTKLSTLGGLGLLGGPGGPGGHGRGPGPRSGR
jgi:Spy/CpxP family protein refolding chaperone